MSDATAAAVRVALLCSTRDDIDELRNVLTDAGSEIVFEADTQECGADAIRAARPSVVLINLPASSDEHSPLLDELAASPELRVIFNDASITSALSGWDRARWRRHLSAKILGLEGDLPPRPDAAPSLRLPRSGGAPMGARGGRDAPVIGSEQLAAEMHSGLARLADSDSVGPPPSHDWASELTAEGTLDVPLDSLETHGVAQQAMGTDMESTGGIDIDIDNDALGLNDDERALLGNLQAFDTGNAPAVGPPLTLDRDEQRVDLELDESAFPGIQVDDFPANDLGAPLGAADEELRLHGEVTSDDATSLKLDAPQGFAELSLAPMDADHAPALAVSTPGVRAESSAASPFANLHLESIEGGLVAPSAGRASFAIDTSERSGVDLSSAATKSKAAASTTAAPDVWILLGGAGSDIGMLELLGELPPTLPAAFVVIRTDAAGGAAEALPLDAWPAGTALAAGQAVCLDPTREVRFDDAGRLQGGSDSALSGGVNAALEALAAQFRARLGLMLFEGQAGEGSDGVAAIIANGGTVWSAVTGASHEWNARAQSLGGLAQSGSALDLAQRLTGATP